MNIDKVKQRSIYANYIAKGLRFALKETGLKQFPDSTIVMIFSEYHFLAGEDQIIGLPILVSNISTSYDFCLGFSTSEESSYKLLKAFDEFLSLYSMEE